jgi:hypothetical protein
MDYKLHKNSHYEKTTIKCGRCQNEILIEVLNNSSRTNHVCCRRLGCTWPDYHSEEILNNLANLTTPDTQN